MNAKPNRRRATKHPRRWPLTYSMVKHYGNSRNERYRASDERRREAAEAQEREWR